MKKLIDLDQHLSITTAHEIEKITKPLIELGIPYFRYLKLYANGTRITLSNYPDLIRYIYEYDNYKSMWFDGGFSNYLKNGWCYRPINHILDPREVEIKTNNELKVLLNMSEGVTYVETSSNFCEVFSFDSNSSNIYAIDKALLMRFILYFKNEARKLIAKAECEKIITSVRLGNFNTQNAADEVAKKLIAYLNSTKIKRYYFGGDYQGAYLTKKEASCIYWMLKGKKVEEIASLENAAVKTVQYHIDNIKSKLNCQKQTQIIQIVSKAGICENLNPTFVGLKSQ